MQAAEESRPRRRDGREGLVAVVAQVPDQEVPRPQLRCDAGAGLLVGLEVRAQIEAHEAPRQQVVDRLHPHHGRAPREAVREAPAQAIGKGDRRAVLRQDPPEGAPGERRRRSPRGQGPRQGQPHERLASAHALVDRLLGHARALQPQAEGEAAQRGRLASRDRQHGAQPVPGRYLAARALAPEGLRLVEGDQVALERQPAV